MYSYGVNEIVRDHKVAVYGGDGRLPEGLVKAPKIVSFPSRKGGGNGGLRRLSAALKGGSFGTLVLLSRWCGHSSAKRLRALCKKHGVDCVFLR